MLDFMRRRAQSLVIKILFVIIVLVFIFWGFGSSFKQNSPTDSIATVGSEEVSQREFQRVYENMKNMYRDAYKDRLTPDLIQALNLKQQALDQLINSKLLQQEARRVGFTVTDTELRDSIQKISIFQSNGQFNQTQYMRVLNYLRMSPSEFEEGQRGDLLQKKLHRLITDAVPVSEDEARELYRLSQERVDLSFIKIASADLLNQDATEKKEIEEYYNSHRESFREPERVRFTYVAYPQSHFEAQVQVTPQDEESFYNSHKSDRFTTPAQVHARHILFTVDQAATESDKAKVKEAATGVLARARAGEDFAALAKAYSQDPGTAPKGGDLGFFPRGRMVKEFEEAAFNLSAGSISDLIESQFGYHIIKAEAVEAQRVRSLEETRAEIRQELIREGASERARTQAQADRDKTTSGSKLAEVAQASGVTYSDTPLVSRDETIPDLGRQPDLIHAALSLTVDQVSAPIKAGEVWYILSPREKVESKIPEFTTVTAEVEKRVRGEKAERLAKAKAETFLAKLREKRDLSAVAAEEKLAVEETGPFTRQGTYVPKMGNLPELKKEAFRLTAEAPVAPQAYVWGGNAFVAVLKEHIPASTADFEKQKDRLREDLHKRKQATAFEDFIKTLKKNVIVTPNLNALLKMPA